MHDFNGGIKLSGRRRPLTEVGKTKDFGHSAAGDFECSCSNNLKASMEPKKIPTDTSTEPCSKSFGFRVYLEAKKERITWSVVRFYEDLDAYYQEVRRKVDIVNKSLPTVVQRPSSSAKNLVQWVWDFLESWQTADSKNSKPETPEELNRDFQWFATDHEGSFAFFQTLLNEIRLRSLQQLFRIGKRSNSGKSSNGYMKKCESGPECIDVEEFETKECEESDYTLSFRGSKWIESKVSTSDLDGVSNSCFASEAQKTIEECFKDTIIRKCSFRVSNRDKERRGSTLSVLSSNGPCFCFSQVKDEALILNFGDEEEDVASIFSNDCDSLYDLDGLEPEDFRGNNTNLEVCNIAKIDDSSETKDFFENKLDPLLPNSSVTFSQSFEGRFDPFLLTVFNDECAMEDMDMRCWSPVSVPPDQEAKVCFMEEWSDYTSSLLELAAKTLRSDTSLAN